MDRRHLLALIQIPFVLPLPLRSLATSAIGIFAVALIIIGLGTGLRKANISPLVAEQYKQTRLSFTAGFVLAVWFDLVARHYIYKVHNGSYEDGVSPMNVWIQTGAHPDRSQRNPGIRHQPRACAHQGIEKYAIPGYGGLPLGVRDLARLRP
ncbi:hypothetical protein BD779DRAFT_1682087 [Infundibulicybe gibba]|nr:hypothetical protein BD779DRAFT_1682087 [Infundibulicybe gibba]